MEVNCDMDLKPYSKTTIVNDDSDMTLLINKFHALPQGYEPDLIILRLASFSVTDLTTRFLLISEKKRI